MGRRHAHLSSYDLHVLSISSEEFVLLGSRNKFIDQNNIYIYIYIYIYIRAFFKFMHRINMQKNK
jgi:hypothetical protein